MSGAARVSTGARTGGGNASRRRRRRVRRGARGPLPRLAAHEPPPPARRAGRRGGHPRARSSADARSPTASSAARTCRSRSGCSAGRRRSCSIASFVGLAVLWPKPRLSSPAERRTLSRAEDRSTRSAARSASRSSCCSSTPGFAGSQTTTNNITPTFVFVDLLGRRRRPQPGRRRRLQGLQPVARDRPRRGGDRLGRRPRGSLPAPMPYPVALGRWPAAAGILAFAWVELVYSGRTDPSTLAVLVLVYAGVQLVGMSLYGIEPWNRYGDAFGVYFGLFARLSPLRWERGALYRRLPLSGLTTLDPVPGHGRAAVHDDRHDVLRRLPAGPTWGEIGAAHDRLAARARPQPGDGPGDRVHDRPDRRRRCSIAGAVPAGRRGHAQRRRRSTSRSTRSPRASRTRSCRSRWPTSSRTTSRCSPTRARRSFYLASDPLGDGRDHLRHGDRRRSTTRGSRRRRSGTSRSPRS